MENEVKKVETNELVVRNEKLIERYLSKSRKIASKYFQQLDLLPGKPQELDYFINILKKVCINNELIRYKDNEKFIASFCTMFPNEIIRAAGARPIYLCSTTYVGANFGNMTLPASVCPLVKSLSEASIKGLNSVVDNCDMYVVPLTCDHKRKLADNLSLNKKTVKLQLPFNRFDDGGVSLFVKELKNISKEISDITGVKVTRKSLAREIKLYGDTQREIEVFNELRSNNDILIRGSHALIVMNALAYDDISNWKIHLERLNKELSERKETGNYLTKKKLPRILLMGSTIMFPNIKVPLLIEEQGGIIVSLQTCLGDRPYDDYASISNDNLEDYYKGLANRALKPCSCFSFPDRNITINKINAIIKEKNIDGVVYLSYQGCLSSAIDCQIINSNLKNKNIPVLNIETDLFTEDSEILKMRIGAFIEMLNLRK